MVDTVHRLPMIILNCLLLLADDVLLSETVIGLQTQLNSLQSASSSLQLKVNMSKSNLDVSERVVIWVRVREDSVVLPVLLRRVMILQIKLGVRYYVLCRSWECWIIIVCFIFEIIWFSSALYSQALWSYGVLKQQLFIVKKYLYLRWNFF